MDPSPEERGRTGLRALGITLIYIAFGTAWILLSDRVAEAAAGEISRLAVFQRLKGLAYVALTGGALFLLIRQGMIRVHRAAVRLRKSEREGARLGNYLRAIIDASPLAIFDLSAHGSIDSIWNPAAERFFGISRLRALGTVPRFVAGDHTRLVDIARDLAGSREKAPLLEMDLVRNDGSTFPAVIAAAAVLSPCDPLVVIVSDTSALHQATSELRAALEEREVLLREIHHRVKNNLQVVCSLVSLERVTGLTAQAEELVARTLTRIHTISGVHEQLYQHADLSRVDLVSYLQELCANARAAYDRSRGTPVICDLEPLEVGVEVAIPLGLLLHELLAGALQDGCADHTGSVNVTLCRVDGHLELGFSSDCGGVSAGTTGGLDRGSRPDALPPQLIAALVNQMGGELLVGATGHITVRVAEPSGSGTG